MHFRELIYLGTVDLVYAFKEAYLFMKGRSSVCIFLVVGIRDDHKTNQQILTPVMHLILFTFMNTNGYSHMCKLISAPVL